MKNGIVIDGVEHELTGSITGHNCEECSLSGECEGDYICCQFGYWATLRILERRSFCFKKVENK